MSNLFCYFFNIHFNLYIIFSDLNFLYHNMIETITIEKFVIKEIKNPVIDLNISIEFNNAQIDSNKRISDVIGINN